MALGWSGKEIQVRVLHLSLVVARFHRIRQ